MPLNIDCHGETHVGRRRPANEDQFMIADLNKSMRVHQTSLGLSHQTRLFGGSQGKLMLVADGVGGSESGERASTLAVDGVTNYVLNAMDWFFRLHPNNRAEFEAELIESFKHSQKKLLDEAKAIPQRRGMATTLTMAYIDWPDLYVVHVGDTRCYHLSQGPMSRLTKDHTMAQMFAETPYGSTTRGDGNDSKGSSGDIAGSNVLWNVVGGSDRALEPELTTAKLSKGDALLLCSDGLTRYVTDDELTKTLDSTMPAADCCSRLIRLANERGGRDNITVVIAKFQETQQSLDFAAAETDTVDMIDEPHIKKPTVVSE